MQFGFGDGDQEERSRNLVRFGEEAWQEKAESWSQGEDEKILQELWEALSAETLIDCSEMEVAVDHGRVYLKGKVFDRQQKIEVQRCVEKIKGVKDIMNDLMFDL